MVLTRAEMRQVKAERRRPAMAGGDRAARTGSVSGDQLLPDPANALVGRVVDVNTAVLVKAKERRLVVVADILKRLVNRGKAISQAIPVREPRVPQ